MSLLSLQRDFRGYLLDEANQLDASVSAQAAVGLYVYHNAYRAQLVSALKDSYERLWAWLGDDAFRIAAFDHIAKHPPSSWTMGDYGAEFADTVDALYPDDNEVAELASIDWALRRAFDGPDSPPLDPATIAAVDWNSARFQFVSTLRFVPVTTNCAAIWTAIADGAPVPPAQLLPQPTSIRVWRAGLEPRFKTIDLAERRALELLLSGLSFAGLCDELAAKEGTSGAVGLAASFLNVWLQDGLVAAID